MGSLKKLNLSHNSFTKKSSFAFAHILKSDVYMRCLDLRSNLIEEEGVTELYESLKNNLSMYNLNLCYNPGLTKKLHR